MKKKTPHQLRLDPADDEEIKKIADLTSLSQVEVIRQVVRAGVQAIRENGYKLPLPLTLKVSPEEQPAVEKSESGSPGRGEVVKTDARAKMKKDAA